MRCIGIEPRRQFGLWHWLDFVDHGQGFNDPAIKEHPTCCRRGPFVLLNVTPQNLLSKLFRLWSR